MLSPSSAMVTVIIILINSTKKKSDDNCDPIQRAKPKLQCNLIEDSPERHIWNQFKVTKSRDCIPKPLTQPLKYISMKIWAINLRFKCNYIPHSSSSLFSLLSSLSFYLFLIFLPFINFQKSKTLINNEMLKLSFALK